MRCLSSTPQRWRPIELSCISVNINRGGLLWGLNFYFIEEQILCHGIATGIISVAHGGFGACAHDYAGYMNGV